MTSKRYRFRGKSFTTFSILWSFLIMAFSGVIMYIRPEGSIASDINWTFMKLTKEGWKRLKEVLPQYKKLLSIQLSNKDKVGDLGT